jgi:hypothetical protein
MRADRRAEFHGKNYSFPARPDSSARAAMWESAVNLRRIHYNHFAVSCVSMRMIRFSRRLPWLLAVLAAPVMAVDIDGKLAPGEWQEARHVTEFRTTQPLTGAAPTYPSEAWILSTPEGLAIAIRNTIPASVPRTRQRVQRDFDEQVDRINVIIDFDGDHRTAYNFRVTSTDGVWDGVVTNEKDFNPDWDGNWRHAVSNDDDGWTAELLIPWYIAAMREAGDVRTIGVYLDRIIAATGDRIAWPYASLDRSRFVSDFQPIEIRSYGQSLFAVTPYVSGLHDNVRDHDEPDAGVDLVWKPNGQTQLTATINPDFGQVESDDLVVNFDATETFFSDKRPFFTENQGIFDFSTPSDFSQVLYTRRVGGPADDGSGLGDITAALKLNGSLGATKYGVFAADEKDDAGRTFGALRVVRDFATQNLGFIATRVERPYLDRDATVVGVDHNWRPNARWNVRTRLMGSDVEEAGVGTRGDGASLWADYEMDRGLRQQVIAMHFSGDLEINDAGYLSRASTNYLHWQVNKRFSDLPESSRYQSKDWRWRVSTDYNDRGQALDHQFRMSRESRLRNGSYEYAQINVNSAGVDDLILRGNGYVWLPPNIDLYFDYQRPRRGRWAYELETEVFSGGLDGNHRWGYTVEFQPKYFISDAFNVYLDLEAEHRPHWLVWQEDNLVGRFEQRVLDLGAGFNWIMSSRHELRLKLQAIGLEARALQGYRVDPAGRALARADPIDDLSVQNLGVQLRYRYEMAPLSYLYVVYGRGGYRQDTASRGSGGLLGDSFSLRDDEQLLIKFSYRFEK